MFYSIYFIYGWKKQIGDGFWIYQFPKSEERRQFGLLIRRDKIDLFSGIQVCHSWENRPVNIFFHNAASVLSKKQKNVHDFFLCSPKNKYFKNFCRTSMISCCDSYSVLNPKQSLINLNLLNWHPLRPIHPWKDLKYR